MGLELFFSLQETSATNSLGLDSVYGLFYLLAGALITGIGLAVLEFIYRCAVDAKRTKVGYAFMCVCVYCSE